MNPDVIPSVDVKLWLGRASFPRCTADVFTKDTLTISAIGDDAIPMRVYQPGEWISATVYDALGYPLYTHTSSTPPKVVDLPLPATTSREVA
jgi:hypothetical protein